MPGRSDGSEGPRGQGEDPECEHSAKRPRGQLADEGDASEAMVSCWAAGGEHPWAAVAAVIADTGPARAGSERAGLGPSRPAASGLSPAAELMPEHVWFAGFGAAHLNGRFTLDEVTLIGCKHVYLKDAKDLLLSLLFVLLLTLLLHYY